MKRIYIRPLSEILTLNVSGNIMDNPMIPVSGTTTPEESDSKQNNWYSSEDDEQNDNNGLW
jgi:hypothetical protein